MKGIKYMSEKTNNKLYWHRTNTNPRKCYSKGTFIVIDGEGQPLLETAIEEFLKQNSRQMLYLQNMI